MDRSPVHDQDNNSTAMLPKDQADQETAPDLSRKSQESPGLGGILMDDYVIEKELGRGGMGSVVLVQNRATKEYFAVKRILANLVRHPAHRRAFLREMLNWSALLDQAYLETKSR